MATFEVTSPDGKTYEINAPEGATKDDVLAYAKQQFQTQAEAPQVSPNIPGQVTRPAQPETKRTLGQSVLGAGEAALSTLSGVPAAALGTISQLPSMLSPLTPKTAKEASKAEERAAGITGALTYAPRTEAGQSYTQAVNDLLQSSGVQGLVGMPIPGKTLPKVASGKPGVTSSVLGLTTGTGGEAVSQAYKAGKAGGEKGALFAENMRGQVPVELVLQDAKDSLMQMKANKSAEYVANKQGWASDTTQLDFTPIQQSVKNLEDSLKEGGKWKIGKDEINKIAEVKQVVNEWNKSPSLHTTVGLDALKQRIDAIYPDSPKQAQAQRVISGVSKSVKDTIVKQAPDYANAMKDYEQMSATIKDIESALSLGNAKSKDTALRKLQSLTRNNVQTNYGNRLDMAKQLEAVGGENIIPAVSGQALSSLTPRGLTGQLGSIGGAYGALTNPAFLAGLPLASPRLVGEGAYRLGQASNYLPSVPKIPYKQSPYAGLLTFNQEEK